MDNSWATLAIIAALAATTVIIGMPTARNQRTNRTSGSASGMLGVMDEIFHPNAYEAAMIVEAQNEAGAPAPSPEDKPFTDGKITINIP